MGILRILLAIAVVIDHSSPILNWMPVNGRLAVEAFFVISGFYMTMILEEKYHGPGGYKLFISNRFLRIFPLYWVVFVITVMLSLGVYLFSGDWFILRQYSLNHITLGPLIYFIFSNIFLFGQDAAVFLGVNAEKGTLFFTPYFRDLPLAAFRFMVIPQAWTLSLELMFYVIAPLIVKGSLKKTLLIILVSLIIRFYVFYILGWNNDPWNRRFFPIEITYFLMGSLSYKVYQIATKKNWLQHAKAVFIAVVVVTLFFNKIPYSEFLVQSYYVFIVLTLPWIFQTTKHSRFDRLVGELSYPVYLVHLSIIKIYNLLFSIPKEWNGLIAVILSLVVSVILVKIVAEPVERLRASRAQQLSI